jgi:hypothetical protein
MYEKRLPAHLERTSTHTVHTLYSTKRRMQSEHSKPLEMQFTENGKPVSVEHSAPSRRAPDHRFVQQPLLIPTLQAGMQPETHSCDNYDGAVDQQQPQGPLPTQGIPLLNNHNKK